MKVADIIVFSVELIFYFFHLSLLIILIWERKVKFHGAFYNMIRLLFICDILIFVNSFIPRLATIEAWQEFFKSNTFPASFCLHFSSYLLLMQFSIHGFVSFNRFTVFWFSVIYKKIWSKQWYIIVLLILPLILILPRLPEKGIFVFTEKRNVVATLENQSSMNSSLLMILTFCIFITLIAAIFNLLAIIKHYSYRKKNNGPSQISETTFLYISCILFISHCLSCLMIIGRTIFTNNIILAFIFQGLWFMVNDVIAWSGSISLIILSDRVRKSYFNFYYNLFKIKQRNAYVKWSKTSMVKKSVSMKY